MTVTFDQMERIQKSIDATARSMIFFALSPNPINKPTEAQWVRMMRVAFPTIEEARREGSILARDYYDSVRDREGLDRLDIDLVNYNFRMLLEETAHLRKNFDATQAQMNILLNTFQKAIRSGNRSTILQAIAGDEDCPGWARIGREDESCAFCLMNVARGPLLKRKFPNMFKPDPIHRVKATQLLKQNTYKAGVELAKRFHPADDCLVVPVFDPEGDWDGKDLTLAARRLWNKTVEDTRGQAALNEVRRETETPEPNIF